MIQTTGAESCLLWSERSTPQATTAGSYWLDFNKIHSFRSSENINKNYIIYYTNSLTNIMFKYLERLGLLKSTIQIMGNHLAKIQIVTEMNIWFNNSSFIDSHSKLILFRLLDQWFRSSLEKLIGEHRQEIGRDIN